MPQPLRELDVVIARVQRRRLDTRVAVGKLVLAHHGSAGAYRVPGEKCPAKTGQTASSAIGENARTGERCKYLTARRQLRSGIPKPSRSGHALKSTIRAPVCRGLAPATGGPDFPPGTLPPRAPGYTRARWSRWNSAVLSPVALQ